MPYRWGIEPVQDAQTEEKEPLDAQQHWALESKASKIFLELCVHVASLPSANNSGGDLKLPGGLRSG